MAAIVQLSPGNVATATLRPNAKSLLPCYRKQAFGDAPLSQAGA
ncbi:MAG: hypothetical protein ABFR19_07230 [Pseudomonadota bacterium]